MSSSGFIISGGKVPYLSIPAFDDTGLVKAGFTTRKGGGSIGCYDSLNLGRRTSDPDEVVLDNYRAILSELELDIDKVVVSDQIHKSEIHVIKENDPIIGNITENTLVGIDGIVTDVKGLVMFTYYADCTPLYFLDTVNGVAGMAHSGWRGTVAKIGKKMVDTMIETYGSRPEDIITAIGPCIGSCCYEVDTPVIDVFKETFHQEDIYTHKHDDKYDLDLTIANRHVLLDAGISKDNIIEANMCTNCIEDLFYSYRRDNGNTGRMCGIMSLI